MSEPRDSAKTFEYYQEAIQLHKQQAENAMAKNNRLLFPAISRYCTRLARASYSAGLPVAECLDWLARAAEYELRYMKESPEPEWAPQNELDDVTEHYAAAYLTGRSNEVVKTFFATKMGKMSTWETSFMNMVSAVFAAKPTDMGAAELKALAKNEKSLAALPGLLKSVSARDEESFPAAFELYLSNGWGPSADAAARKDLKSKYAIYMGKWCFLSAALCRMMGGVPKLSKKAVQYVPLELVG
jgi:hypothetical protein